MNCKKCKYRGDLSGTTICNYSATGNTCLYMENGIVKDRRGEGECQLFEKGRPKVRKPARIDFSN